MLQALKVDLQQSTPHLGASEWCEVKTPWLPNQHRNGFQGSLLLFCSWIAWGLTSSFDLLTKKEGEESDCWVKEYNQIYSDLLFCTGSTLNTASVCHHPMQMKTAYIHRSHREWHLVWNTRLVKGWPFSSFFPSLPWRMIILYICTVCP